MNSYENENFNKNENFNENSMKLYTIANKFSNDLLTNSY